ncbi:MAG: sugar phosphate isomerase/epimerase [Oscillospiraceae bacterium]|nr:sugar phosphate isomerase/epimerase [Oscillospiraceae bacterium]
MEIGAQFYTLNQHCKTLDDFALSLKKVADIGYKNVQISGTCAYEADWLKEQLDKNGLKCVLTHIDPKALTEETEKVARDHDVFNCDYIGSGWYGFMEDAERHAYDGFVEMYKPVAKKMKEMGKYFMFHNHAREFQRVDGVPILEKIAQDFAPDELGFILDTYWVQFAGGDPAAWIEKLSGRLPVIHLKDMTYHANGGRYAVIGEGNINFDRVFEKAEKAGTKYLVVEQDECYGEDPFDCLKRSFNNLAAMGFR